METTGDNPVGDQAPAARGATEQKPSDAPAPPVTPATSDLEATIRGIADSVRGTSLRQLPAAPPTKARKPRSAPRAAAEAKPAETDAPLLSVLPDPPARVPDGSAHTPGPAVRTLLALLNDDNNDVDLVPSEPPELEVSDPPEPLVAVPSEQPAELAEPAAVEPEPQWPTAANDPDPVDNLASESGTAFEGSAYAPEREPAADAPPPDAPAANVLGLSAGRVAGVDDFDDFGPLVAPTPRRVRRSDRETAPRHPRRRRLLTAAAAGVLILGGAVGAAMVFHGDNQKSQPAAVQQQGVQMRAWHGMGLPVSAAAGPQVFGDRASGFARTELGAAIAAANLSVRLDPAAGARVYGPVLADQVTGDRERLARALASQPAPTSPGEPGVLVGWRLDGDPASDPVLVHLGVRAADGSAADYAVALTWIDGDWQVQVPSSGQFFPVTAMTGAYRAFEES